MACSFSSHPNAHQRAMTASHSYLFMNPFSCMMMSETSLRYILRKCTSSSGSIFSDMLVNPAISEKKLVIVIRLPSSFTSSNLSRIFTTSSSEIYWERAHLRARFQDSSYMYLYPVTNMVVSMTMSISCTGRVNNLWKRLKYPTSAPNSMMNPTSRNRNWNTLFLA